MGFELSPEYKDVPARIADFKAKHPEGALQPANPAEPYRIEALDGRFFIVYTAAAYRSAEDKLPGIGIAWEPFPGKTPYTKDSELQNAETSAWGRAIIAALASESKHIASAEDVRNRQADAAVQPVDRFVAPTGETIDIWPGELSMKDAKGELLAALGGDKDAATKAWSSAGFDGRWKLRREELDPLLLLMRGGSQVGAGVTQEESPSAAGATAGSSPATAAPAPESPDVIDARAIAQRSNALFEAAIGEDYPPRKKTWLNKQLRHSLVYVATNGDATSSKELEGTQFLSVWRLLDAIEDGKLTFTWSADPAKGVEWRWPDGSTNSVLWVELNLAGAGAVS